MQLSREGHALLGNGSIDTFLLKRDGHNSRVTLETGVFSVGCAPRIYRVIQDELPPLVELISEDILSKNCQINMGPIFNIYSKVPRPAERSSVE
jgi:hypothetical protein